MYCKNCDNFLFKKLRRKVFRRKWKSCKVCQRIVIEFSTKMQNEYHEVFPVIDDIRKLWEIGRSRERSFQEIEQEIEQEIF